MRWHAVLFALALVACDDGVRPAGPPELPTVHVPAPLRRLSHVEYRNTLGDLLGVDTSGITLPEEGDRLGLENDARSLAVSDGLLRRYDASAREAIAAAIPDATALGRVLPCAAWSTPTEIETCGAAFVSAFGRRAYRRPLTAEESERMVAAFRGWATDIDVHAAVTLTMLAFVSSPAFLYHLEGHPSPIEAEAPVAVQGYEMASRLSYALWQSMPDDALLDAAERGELDTADEIEAAARRMLDDPRAARTFADFHRQWLDLDRILSPMDHASRADDPAWSPATQASAHEEAMRFLRLVWEGDATLGALFTSRDAEVDAETARLYGVEAPASGWARTTLEGAERGGILTRIAVLASHAHPGYASPPVRGNFVVQRITCRALGAPPPGVDLSQPVPEPGEGPRTNRELFAARTASPICQNCHSRIDGIGFGLEHYDERGVFRATDEGMPVDARGELVGLDVEGAFDGAIELGERLAESRIVGRCYTQRWLEFVHGRAMEAADAGTVSRLHDRFTLAHGDVRDLWLAIVTDPSFTQRHPELE